MRLRQFINQNKILRTLASLKVTVVCLFLLFVLTFWGTVAQVEQGLLVSQERFFFSWYFLVFGVFPFPGARLVMWVLFVNLLLVSLSRFVYRLSHLGIILIHIGLLSYFVAAFFVFHLSEESNVTLREGEAANVSQSYHRWELSVWPDEANPQRKQVRAYDLDDNAEGSVLDFPGLPFKVTVSDYLPNAKALTVARGPSQNARNDSGIRDLIPSPRQKEPEKNLPGAVFEVAVAGGNRTSILLYGGESNPTSFSLPNGETYHFQLRRRRYPLPFLIKLKEFTKETHPGTEIAKSFESLVTIKNENLERDTLIYMNNPLRYKNYTFYQASYGIDAMGRELSTLAVVKNSGQYLPYVASLITFLGLMYHFLREGFVSRERKTKHETI